MLDHPLMHFMFDLGVSFVFLSIAIKYSGLILLDLYRAYVEFRDERHLKVNEIVKTWKEKPKDLEITQDRL